MSDSSREAFEAWWGQPPTEFVVTQCRTEEEKVNLWAWQAWQASRKQALEEAIQAAQPKDTYMDAWFDAKADSVRKIEALK